MGVPPAKTSPPAMPAWDADIKPAGVWDDGLACPFDDAPGFDKQEDPEVDVNARLHRDLAYKRTPTRRLFKDYRANPEAYAHLADMPANGESLHGVISGKYALFELVPALIERAGKIDELHIATLSFNKQNAGDILGLLDAGDVRRINLLISYYFKSTSRPIYDALVPELRERGHKVLAMRTHAKMLLVKMRKGGARYVIESSANLRSSVNIEQFVMTRDRGLYEFHRRWMDEELFSGIELGDPRADETKK